jgi:hypothetical protein
MQNKFSVQLLMTAIEQMGITAGKQPIEAKNTRHKEVSLLAKSGDYTH